MVRRPRRVAPRGTRRSRAGTPSRRRPRPRRTQSERMRGRVVTATACGEGESRGPEGSPVWIQAGVQQDLAVAVVLGPRLRQAAPRGSGPPPDVEEALRARGRLED